MVMGSTVRGKQEVRWAGEDQGGTCTLTLKGQLLREPAHYGNSGPESPNVLNSQRMPEIWTFV